MNSFGVIDNRAANDRNGRDILFKGMRMRIRLTNDNN